MSESTIFPPFREIHAWLRPLLSSPDGWNTLDVDYDPPHVERLWRPFGDYRVNLHRIHPCEVALFHPHPWPSAVLVLSGVYEMAVGYSGHHGDKNQTPPVAMTVRLTEGSTYEMTDRDAWHAVRPLSAPSLSLMITGKPWGRWSPSPSFKLKPLSEEKTAHLLADFLNFYY